MIKLNKEKIKRILIIKLRGIGDVVHSTIVLDNLKNEFPSSKIDYLVEEPSKPGLEGIASVTDILLFDRNNFWKKVLLILKIRKNKYDIVLDFFSNPSTALVTFFSGANFRIGYPYRGRRYAYNIFGPSDRGKFHSALLHLEMLKMIGLSTSSEKIYYNINSSALIFAKKYFKTIFTENDFVIGICPTGGWNSKKCDPDKFAEIASAITLKYKVKIIILWGKSDKDDALKINSLLNGKAILAPDTNIQELSALISKCKLLVANDSGPMHISTAVGTPVLGLFGPTNPETQGPFGSQNDWIQLTDLECIRCNLLECPKNHECFKNIGIDLVLEKIIALLKKNKIELQPIS